MKTRLKDNIFIEGFDTLKEVVREQIGRDKTKEFRETLYEGKTSEIPEEIAKGCVLNWRIDGLYNNYKISSQYEEYMFKTAKESIQSACNQPYCIIYKTK